MTAKQTNEQPEGEMGQALRIDVSAGDKPPLSRGSVYFIACMDTFRFKIGYTAGDPFKRMDALQTGSSTRLFLAGSLPGTMDLEKKLHARFAKDRVRGEWFDISAEFSEFMRFVDWYAGGTWRLPAALVAALRNGGRES